MCIRDRGEEAGQGGRARGRPHAPRFWPCGQTQSCSCARETSGDEVRKGLKLQPTAPPPNPEALPVNPNPQTLEASTHTCAEL
eukprot:358199-Chlamydomonas_euryale.AAC.4